MEKWQTENKEKLTILLKEWGICIIFLKNLKSSDGQQINFSTENVSNPGQRCFTLENVDKQLNLTIVQLGKIIGSENVYSISDNSLKKLEDNIKSLQENVLALYNSCVNLDNRDENTEYSIDEAMNISYQFQKKMAGIPVTEMFKKILNDSASLLDSYSCIPYMPKGKRSNKFTIHSNLLEQASVQAESSLSKIKKDHQNIEAQSIEIQELYKKATDAQKGITNLFNQSELASTSIGKNKTEIEANKTRIDEVIEKSKKLEELVNNYQSNFNEFAESLLEKNENYKQQNKQWEEIEAKIGETYEKLKTYEKEAGKILGISTIAELSRSFKEKEDKISVQLKWAQIFNFIALFLFIFYSLYVFLGNNFDIDTLKIESLILKFTLALPFLLLVGFTNRRYKELFKLKEHYAYKDSIAASIPGFKEQSGEYKDLLATAFFSKLAFNPADDIGTKKGKEEPESLYKAAINFIKEKMDKSVKTISKTKVMDTPKNN